MSTVLIPLSHDSAAMLDEEDLPFVAGFKWRLVRRHNGPSYAGTKQKVGGRWRDVTMHRLLMDAPPDLEVDHRDGDSLNNCRSNLRLATRSQNSVNVGPRRRNATGFKGVYWEKRRKHYIAQMTYQGHHLNFGSYHSAEEAARAYDAKARELHGEFAHLNFPD